MENVNSTATATATLRQQQQQQQHFQLQQHQQEQQQQHEHQQQFCLRWHNHQTSLLSTLPILLDQSHLTDVTISAEGRTLRAHRVVLSACSTFFLELFRALDITNHPVIILPGASFAAIVALLTFMYSGEVNVYEEQIPVLLNLAETLGVKGLADVQNNKSSTSRQCSMDYTTTNESTRKDDAMDTLSSLGLPSTISTPTPPPAPASAPPMSTAYNSTGPLSMGNPAATTPQHPLGAAPLLAGKLPTQLENFFLKSLQFYPNLLPQPLNFSQTALNKTSELLAKYQQQCSLYQGALSTFANAASGGSKEFLTQGTDSTLPQQRLTATPPLASKLAAHEEPFGMKRFCTGEKLQACNMFMQHQQQQQYHHQQKDIKRIDKIVESLRCSSGSSRQQLTPKDNLIAAHQIPAQQNANKSAASPSATSSTTAAVNSCSFAPLIAPQLGITKPPPIYAAVAAIQSPQQHTPPVSYEATTTEEQAAAAAARSLQQHIEQFASCSRSATGNSSSNDNVSVANPKIFDSNDGSQLKSPTLLSTATAPAASLHNSSGRPTSLLPMPTSPTAANATQAKTPSNSKLYATCFICHKQLSNQYNLRVHLETHQNVRYACNVCSHVSRSKDALRKHVSYRHPGAPSPCETEARRKRATKILLSSGGSSSSSNNAPTSPIAQCATNIDSGNSSANNNSNNEVQLAAAAAAAAAAQLNSAAAAYMFLPNQFHLAAAAAAAVQQQQQQLQQPLAQLTQNSASNSTVASMELDATLPTSKLAATTATTATTLQTTAAPAAVPVKIEQHSPPELASSPPSVLQRSKSNDSAVSNRSGVLTAATHSSPS